MKTKVARKTVSKPLAATVVLFIAIECLIRVAYFVRSARVTHVPLPYVIGHDYGPVPPWLEGLLILAPDKDLIWKNRPNLRRRYVDIFSPIRTEEERLSLYRRFNPTLAGSLKEHPAWEVRLNSEGYRDGEMAGRKPAPARRVVCLGDSWTFGMNVAQEQAYPQRLQALLRQALPGAEFEVLNRGVLGYSSYQGLELLRRKIVDWEPDVVVLGFAMNDAKVVGYRDKDMAAYERHPDLRDRVRRVFEKSEGFRLAEYGFLVWQHKPSSIGHHLREEAESPAQGSEAAEFDKLEPWTRVSPQDYEKNIRDMVRLAKDRKAGVVLLYNELREDGPYRAVLGKIAQEERVPWVDSSALIRQARRELEAELEGRLGLIPAATQQAAEGGVEVVFRVYMGKTPVPKAVYIAGPHTKLGGLVPNQVALYDDGTHGDQRAGDGVWTYSAALPPGTRLPYVYTNSGGEGKWEGLDVPHLRELKVAAGPTPCRLYQPIDCFGKIYMQADSWHTDASGYERIANALLEVLQGSEKIRGRVPGEQNSAARLVASDVAN